MNSTLLLLNAVALAVLVTFHFQAGKDSDSAQISQTGSYHAQQRPQLALMTGDGQSSVHLAQGAQAASSSEHLIF